MAHNAKIHITITDEGKDTTIEAHIAGAEIKRDFWTQRIISVGSVRFRYGWDGKLLQAGNAKISYNFSGKVNQIGYDSRLDIVVTNLSS
ncbi:MAG: hypothetical protein AAFV98_03630 [Chloroflexota bacterium]